MESTVGRALGSRYVLGEALGSGAMGQVFQATDSRTGEQVAAKLLRSDFARDPVILARFVQERTVLLDLVHPHVVQVRDLVVEGESLAIVMDLVRGKDLGGLLAERGTLPPSEAVELCAQVLDALAFAHGRGVLHRDVKPDNVLLQDGQAKLSDFGIARLAQETTVRATGALGTPEYMAPEVFTAEQVSGATDVYAVGTMLYELLAGRTPFAGGSNGYAVVNRHVTAEPPALPGLPLGLVGALAALLAKDPRRRLSASAAADALRALRPEIADLAALPVQAQPETWAQVRDAAPVLGVLGHREGGVVDPGETNLRGVPAEPSAGPQERSGEAAWIGPAPDVSVERGYTVISAPRAVRPELLEPVESPAQKASHRTRWLVLAGVVVLLVAAGLLAVLHGGGGGQAPKAAVQQVEPATSVPGALETDESGLSVQRAAAWDPKTRSVTTTLQVSSLSGTLTGPLLEAVPPLQDGGDCPDVVWSGVTATRSTVAGVDDDACAYELRPGAVTKTVSTFTYTVPLAIAGDQPSLLSYLQRADTVRTAALTGLTGAADYPLQRLEYLDVEVGQPVRQNAAIPLVIAPLWLGATQPDHVHVLFDARHPAPTALLTSLGGGLAVNSDDCSSSIAFTHNAPYANNVATGCTITARLGSIAAPSQQFAIASNAG